MGKMIPYAKTPAYTVWRDTSSHNGFIEDNATGERSLWFVCIEGAEWLQDNVALRCDFSEYTSLDAFNAEYQPERPYKTIDDLRDDSGTVLEFEGGIIVADF
jgi:hypothetical protein